MSLLHRGTAEVHTPSTGLGVEHRDVFDASLVLGEGESNPLESTVEVIQCDFASRGFYALIGRDILCRCVLTYDGPANMFTCPGHPRCDRFCRDGRVGRGPGEGIRFHDQSGLVSGTG